MICCTLDARIVRVLNFKTDGLLPKISQTPISPTMSGFGADELLPRAGDIGVMLSQLHAVLQASDPHSDQYSGVQ